MPIEDYYQNKNIRYLILGLIIISLVILLKEVILKQEQISVPEPLLLLSPIEIDFELLESQEIEELLPFEKLSLPEELGRENPFIPY